MSHPELPEPRCRSCDRLLGGWNQFHVPAVVECCFWCWRRVPVSERLKIRIMLDDRGPNGVLPIVAELVSEGILERRKGEK